MKCKYCNRPIERSNSSACGWTHTETQRVMCLLDATPQETTIGHRCTSDPNSCNMPYCSWPNCTEPTLR